MLLVYIELFYILILPMINNDEVVVELQRILARREYILSVADSDSFHFEYDALCKDEPLNWSVSKLKTFFEYPFEWAKDIETYIDKAKQDVKYLEEQWILKPYWEIEYHYIVVRWHERVPFDEYLSKKVSQIKHLREKDEENNPALYLAKVLDINPSQVRHIYIKLLLEGKINIWDLKDLCAAKNSDVDLYKYVSQWI